MRKTILVFTIIFITFALSWSSNLVFSQGKAVLYLEPSSGSFKLGETFQIEVRIDTKGSTINSTRGIINFPTDKLEVIDLGRDQSIFTFWDPTTSFSNSSGEIIFGGGLPSPGFSDSSGRILKLTFKAKGAGVATIEFKEASVLADDEKGTDILGKLEKGTYKIETEIIPVPVEDIPSVQKLEPPEITTYPNEISSIELFYLEGLALPKSTVILYIEKENEEPIVKKIDVSSDGSWSYIHNKFLQPGKYSIYTRAKIKTGEISENSQPIDVLVKKGALEVGGFLIKNETLYGIIILILILGIFTLSGFFIYLQRQRSKNRRKLSKEIREANESVVNGFSALKEEVRRELNTLQKLKITEDRLSPKDKKARREILDDLLEDLELLEKVEKYIRKEIKDVEDILPG